MSKTDSLSEEKIRAEEAAMPQWSVAVGQRTTDGGKGKTIGRAISSIGQEPLQNEVVLVETGSETLLFDANGHWRVKHSGKSRLQNQTLRLSDAITGR